MAQKILKPLILVIDDEQAILQVVKDALTDEGFRVHTSGDGKQALSIIGELLPDVILLDIFMPHYNGLDLLKKIKEQYPSQQVIIMSGFGTIPIAVNALNLGARDFIEKPLDLNELLEKILATSSHHDLAHSNHSKEYSAWGIIGKSELFYEFMRQVDLIAPLAYNVLLYGPEGSGKYLTANYIHQQSPLAEHEFTIIDCSNQEAPPSFYNNIPANGTLFIKNIDRLSVTNQHKLYAYLATAQKDVRLIASAAPNLFSKMQQGLFYDSLFYLLNIIPLEIVSLEKRRYDIPLLATHFLAEENNKQGKCVTLSAEAMRCLRNYSWQSNISELKNTITRLVVMAPNKQELLVEHLSKQMDEQVALFCEEQSFKEFTSLDEATKAFQHQYLMYLFKKNGYQLETLSNQLNIDVETLRKKIQHQEANRSKTIFDKEIPVV